MPGAVGRDSQVLDLIGRYATVSDVPVIADLKGPRSLGIAGDDEVRTRSCTLRHDAGCGPSLSLPR